MFQNLEQAAQAVQNVSRISRKQCRKVFEQRFTATRMASDYIALYRQLIYRRPTQETHRDLNSSYPPAHALGGNGDGVSEEVQPNAFQE